jgi:hypothetical protein
MSILGSHKKAGCVDHIAISGKFFADFRAVFMNGTIIKNYLTTRSYIANLALYNGVLAMYVDNLAI